MVKPANDGVTASIIHHAFFDLKPYLGRPHNVSVTPRGETNGIIRIKSNNSDYNEGSKFMCVYSSNKHVHSLYITFSIETTTQYFIKMLL